MTTDLDGPTLSPKESLEGGSKVPVGNGVSSVPKDPMEVGNGYEVSSNGWEKENASAVPTPQNITQRAQQYGWRRNGAARSGN